VTIVLVDTSVFCNLLDVPGFHQQREEAFATLKSYLKDRASLLLPLAAIYETGNHIAHVGDGDLRRTTAKRFCKQVREAISGEAPWTTTPLPDAQQLESWLAEFPDCAMRGVGIADLSIIKEFERQCALHYSRRVRIWSYNPRHLAGYDRGPRLRL